jgi:hypothetical protein
LTGINLRVYNQAEVFPLSFQQHSYAVQIDGHISKKQGQDLMDTGGIRLSISTHNTTKQWQKKTTTYFFLD